MDLEHNENEELEVTPAEPEAAPEAEPETAPVPEAEPEEKQPPPQERKDWVERFLAFSKRKWYLLGWVLIAWGVLDLVQLALFYLAYRGMLGGFTGLIGWDMAEMGGVNLLDVFPAGVLLFPALYAAVKIAAGVLGLYFGKRHVQKKREEEMQ